MVPIWLVWAREVELAHLGEVPLLGMLDQKRLPSVQGCEVVEVTIRFFCIECISKTLLGTKDERCHGYTYRLPFCA